MANSTPVVLPSDQSSIPVAATLQAGTAAFGKLAANSGVDIGDVDVTSLPALPAGTNNIGDVDVLTLPVAFNTGTRSATTQRVTIATDDSVPVTGTFWQATQPVSGTVTANAGTGTLAVSLATNTPVGNVAHDAADSGAPVKVGLYATSANRTRVASADRVDAIADLAGRQVVTPHQVRELVTDATTTITSSTTETTILAAAASTFHDVTAIMLINTSATATRVDIRDATAGTIRMSFYLPAGDTRGINLTVPRPQTAVNNNWTAQCSVSVADVRIWIQAVKNV